uniref:Lin-28A-like second zinc knuckle domain-containing protein n=1 Tax=Bos mutus grunniens TaxID=30521 RepID=A0A8B9YF13_BOSMU
MATHSSVLAWRIPGTGSLVGCHLWGHTESETTAPSARGGAKEPQVLHSAGFYECFSVCLAFGVLPAVGVSVHQSKLHLEGFWRLKEGEAVEFTFKKSAEGLASIRVTGPGVLFCVGSEGDPKERICRNTGQREMCYNCGGLDHHKCNLSPQSNKCHFCYSTNHMVASCLLKAQQAPSSQGKKAYFREEEENRSPATFPESRSLQMHVRALGVNPPCMLYLSLHPQNLQLLKVAWVENLFYS